MSRENVELVRRVYEAVARGDTDAVLSVYDPEIEWDFLRSPFREFLKHDVYRGHSGIRSFIRERSEDAFREVDDHLEELIDAGGQVVSVVTSRGRGRSSGAAVERTHAGVWTIRAGAIVRVTWFGSREEALDAVASP